LPEFETSVAEDGAVSGTVIGTDVDGDTLQYNLESGAANGQVVLLQNGAFTYTPNPDFNGSDSFMVSVSDDSGASTVAAVNITVSGINDSPEITSAPGEATGSVVEDSTDNTVSGTLSATDIDIGAVLTWSGSEQGNFGSFEISENGTWTYTLDGTAADSLSANQTASETFTATVTDDQGATVEQQVTVTINGSNDPAQITGDTTGQVTEDAAVATVSGDLGHTDVDSNNAPDQFRAQAGGTLSDKGFGTFAVSTAGVWIFTLNNAHAAVTALSPGDKIGRASCRERV